MLSNDAKIQPRIIKLGNINFHLVSTIFIDLPIILILYSINKRASLILIILEKCLYPSRTIHYTISLELSNNLLSSSVAKAGIGKSRIFSDV